MAQISIHAEFIRLRYLSSDARATGLTVELLPEGASAPGGLITLTANAALANQYDFPAGVINGKHTLYLSGVVATQNSVNIEIEVIRNGKIDPKNLNFGDTYDGI